MISHLLDPVVKLDPEEVIFIIGFMGEQIKEYVRENYAFKSTFITQDKLLGLGYALDLAVRDLPEGDLLVLLGDTIVECDLHSFVHAGDYVLGLRQVNDPQRFGIAEVENGQVVGLEEKPEKPRTNLAVIGLYYFKAVELLKKMLADLVASGRTSRGEIQFTDALQDMIRQGVRFVPYEVREWFDCGKKETLLSTNRHLVSALGQTPQLEGSAVVAPVYIHPDAKIVNSVIGPFVSISQGAVVRNCVIKNSIIGSDTTIDNMVIADSVLGHKVTLKGTSQVLNLGDSSEIAPTREVLGRE
jgi:glucose-1-phosphate thymidylyltransferase